MPIPPITFFIEPFAYHISNAFQFIEMLLGDKKQTGNGIKHVSLVYLIYCQIIFLHDFILHLLINLAWLLFSVDGSQPIQTNSSP